MQGKKDFIFPADACFLCDKSPLIAAVLRDTIQRIVSSSKTKNAARRTDILFYVHVTVHRSTFPFNKTNRRTNFQNLFCQETLHVFGQFLCPSSGAVPGWNCSSILVVLESCHQTCMTYTSAEYTVENS